MQTSVRLVLWISVLMVATCACQGRSYGGPRPTDTSNNAVATGVYMGDSLPELADQGPALTGGNLVVAAGQEPASLNYQLDPGDTWARRVGSLVLDSLAQPNPLTWQPEPHLAERWVISPDGLTLTFTLRANVSWDDGIPLTADDVLFTFNVLRDPNSKAVAARALLSPLEHFEKVDEHTVRFHFSRPYAFAFAAISETAIYPHHLYAGGDFNNHPANRTPAASGPYRLVRWLTGDRIILARNPRYWGKPAALQQITFRILPWPDQRLRLLKRGEVDVIERLTPELWQTATADKSLAERFWRLRHVPSSLQWLGYNERLPYFTSAAVRRALTMLLDRQSIVRDLRQGVDTIAASWFYPGAREYSANIAPWPYDPTQAARLLDEAGWLDHDSDGVRDKHGVPMAFTLLYPQGNGMYSALASRVRDALAAAQIHVTAASVPWPEYIDRLSRGDFDACMSLWSMLPHSDPYLIWHSSAVGEHGFNFVRFANPEADRLLEDARATLDDGKRVALYQQLNTILHREEPYTMLFHRYHLSLVSRRFGGVYSTPYGLLRYEHFYLRDTRRAVASP